MLTKYQLDTFNEDHITIYVPAFAEELDDADKIWLTFCYMVGQQWGFEPFQAQIADYKIIKGIYQNGSITVAHVAHPLNLVTGEWVKFGYTSDEDMFIDIHNPHWEFVEHKIYSPRLQRIWIHLYNAVFTTNQRREDLITGKKRQVIASRPLIPHTDWFTAGISGVAKSTPLNDDYTPRYINPYNVKPKFKGERVWPKIVQRNGT